MTTANLAAIVVISLLLGATFAVYGIRFLAWTDRDRPVTDDLDVEEYRDAAADAAILAWSSATWADFERVERGRAQ